MHGTAKGVDEMQAMQAAVYMMTYKLALVFLGRGGNEGSADAEMHAKRTGRYFWVVADAHVVNVSSSGVFASVRNVTSWDATTCASLALQSARL